MATTVAEAFITMRPDFGRFNSEVQTGLIPAAGAVDNLGQNVDKVTEKSGRLRSALGNVATVAGGFLAAQAISRGVGAFTSGISGAIQGASDLEQSIGGMQSVFKENADQMLAWGETAHESVGLSKNAFNELAAPLGAMLKSAGFSMDEVSDHTLNLTERAADLAATFGGPVDEAVAAIGSLIRGETNPIERYGVAIKQADVNTRALADTGKQSTKDLTPMELQQARLALLFEQTADSQGQFAREADTAAGQAERLRAKQENLSAQIGEHLLPMQVKLTQAKAAFVDLLATRVVPFVAGTLIPTLASLGGDIRAVAERVIELGREAFATLEPILRPVIGVIGSVVSQLGGFSGVLGRITGPLEALGRGVDTALGWLVRNEAALIGVITGVSTVLATTYLPVLGAWIAAEWAKVAALTASAAAFVVANAPMIAFAATIGTVAAAVIWLVRNWDDVTERFPILGHIVDGVREQFERFGGWITGTFVPTLQSIASTVGSVGSEVVGFVRQHWDTVMSIVQPIIDQLVLHVQTGFGVIREVFQIFNDLLRGDFSGAWRNFKELIDVIWQGITGSVGNATELLKAILAAAWPAIRSVASSAWNSFKDLLGRTWDDIVRKVEGTREKLKDAILWPFREGERLIGSIVSGIGNKARVPFNRIIEGIEGFANGFGKAVNWISSALGLGDLIGTVNLDSWKIGRFAKGGVHKGGPALVGEEGPELRFDPAGTRYLSKEDSLAYLKAIAGDATIGGWGIPGPGDVTGALKGAAGWVKDGARGLLEDIGGLVGDITRNMASRLLDKAMDAVGFLMPDFPGIFSELPQKVFSVLKDELLDIAIDWIKGARDAVAATGVLGKPLGSYSISQLFGMTSFARRGAYGGGIHTGVDLVAPTGTPVLAADGGEVTRAGWNGGYGNYIRILHDGMETAYGHLHRIGVKLGEIVSKGDQIGAVGSTGYSTGAHLHFETFHNGRRVDPMSLVALAEGGIVTRPTLAMLGESGPEKVTPLRDGDEGVHIHFHGDVYGMEDFERKVGEMASRFQSRRLQLSSRRV